MRDEQRVVHVFDAQPVRDLTSRGRSSTRERMDEYMHGGMDGQMGKYMDN